MRKITLYSSRLDVWHEFQESIVLNPPGTRPEESLNLDAITVANLKGQTKTYTWTKEASPEWKIQPKGACIQMINVKSKYKPFSIVPPENTMVAFFSYRTRDSYFNNWVGPVRSHTVERVRPYQAKNFDKPTNTCLGWFVKVESPPVLSEPSPPKDTSGWKPYEQAEESVTRLLLNGLNEKTASDLAVLGRAWLQAPKLEPLSESFSSEGYDQSQLAFRLTNRQKAKNPILKFVILASEESPVIDPAFVVNNWGDFDANLQINGKWIERGKNFRFGLRRELKGTDLIVWLKLESTQPIEIELSSASI